MCLTMKVLGCIKIFAFLYVIVEDTQIQYFDKLISKQFANINALFLATFSEPILLIVRTTK